MDRRRLGSISKRAALVGLAALVTIVAVALLRHPWAIAALREGSPPRAWPPAGRFVEQGEGDAELVVWPGGPVATTEFLAEFERADTSALVVVRDGDVVYARFAEGYDSTTRFNSYSMSKGLVGLLALKAVSDGVIAGLDATVGELWPAASSSAIAPVPIGDLLDMRSGIAFEKDPGQTEDAAIGKRDQIEDYGPFSSLARLHVQGADTVLSDAQLIEADRGRYSYQQFNTAILGRMLEEVYGTPLEQLVDEQLAQPADAGGFAWRRYREDDRVSPYCCVYATALWWARIGAFVLDNGGGEPFLTEEWHDYALGRDFSADELHDGEYRSQLRYDILDRDGERWQGPFAYFAGLGGQMTYVVPDQDLVVVRFGDGYQLLHSTLYEISRFEAAG